VRPFLEGRHLAVAHLVQDPPGVFVAEVVHPGALGLAERAESGRRQLRREGERLQAGEDAVAAEHGHEPGETGRRQAPAAPDDRRREAQGRQVDEAATVGCLERVPVRFLRRGFVQPALQAPRHVRPGLLPSSLVLRPASNAAGAGGGDHVDVRRPLTVRLDAGGERQAVLVELGRCRGRDRRLAPIRLALVAEEQAPVLDASRVAALLLERVLHLEEVGEVAGGLDSNGQVNPVIVMVEDGQLLVEAVTDRPLANHGQLRVDIDRSGARDEEEAGLEVLEVVDGQRIETLAVDSQHPGREEAVVE
jgi:hypothetical protein